MRGVKVLQLATVLTFVVFVAVGLVILGLAPERMSAFSGLLTAIFPLFIAEVVPAFLGSPLKEFVRNKNEGK